MKSIITILALALTVTGAVVAYKYTKVEIPVEPTERCRSSYVYIIKYIGEPDGVDRGRDYYELRGVTDICGAVYVFDAINIKISKKNWLALNNYVIDGIYKPTSTFYVLDGTIYLGEDRLSNNETLKKALLEFRDKKDE